MGLSNTQVLYATINNEGLRIKRANETDLDRVVSLVADFYVEERRADERAIVAGKERLKRAILKKLREKERNWYFLAYLKGELVGLLQIFVISGKLAELIVIYILPKFRRQGLGEFLVRWGMDLLKKQGMKFLRTEIRETNPSSRRLFSKFNLYPYSSIYTIKLG